MILSEFFALTTYLPEKTTLFGQSDLNKEVAVPLGQLRFLNHGQVVAFLPGNKPLTLGQLQTRLRQVSPKIPLACLIDQPSAQPLLGFRQDDHDRLILY